MSKKDEALKLALSTLANARDWIGNDPEGRWNEDEMYDELCNMVKFVSEALAEQPAPPPECQTEAEKTAFAFGWWKALEQKRKDEQPSKPWVGLEEQDMPDGENPMYDDPRFIAGMVWANNKLREKNA